MSEFVSFLIPGLSNGAIYALIGLGFVLIYKTSQVLNIAQGELFVFGAYVAWTFLTITGMPTWAGFLLTFAVMAFLGFSIERVALRPMQGQPVLAIILMTLGLAIFLQGIDIIFWGHDPKSLPVFMPTGSFEIAGVKITYSALISFITAAALLLFIALFLRYSRVGLRMMAAADNEQTAQSLGINVSTVIAFSWIIASCVATVGGVLLTSATGISYTLSGMGMKAIAVVLFGGLESVVGILIAGPVVGVIESTTAGYLDPLVGGGIREVTAYILLLIVIIIRPYGLFGWKRIERV